MTDETKTEILCPFCDTKKNQPHRAWCPGPERMRLPVLSDEKEMTDETKLLPKSCPFCKSPLVHITNVDVCWVRCDDCMCEGPSGDSEEAAIAAWNNATRQPSEEVEQVLRDGVSVIEEIRNQALICKNTEPPQMCWVNSEWLAHAATSLLSKINALLAKKGGGQ